MLQHLSAIDLTPGFQLLSRVEGEPDERTREQVFEAFVHRQSRFVFRIAYAVLRNASDAEDVVQETFLKLFRSGRWTALDNERAFLARAVWRLAISRRPKCGTGDPDSEVASVDLDPEQTAIAADEESAVLRAIDSLPEDLRVPLALSGIEALTSPEIARVMGIPEGTVRTRIQRAREMVKRKIKGMGR